MHSHDIQTVWHETLDGRRVRTGFITRYINLLPVVGCETPTGWVAMSRYGKDLNWLPTMFKSRGDAKRELERLFVEWESRIYGNATAKEELALNCTKLH